MEEIGESRKLCFVTGGSGFVGYNLLICLLETEEWDIVCMRFTHDNEVLTKRLLDLVEENSEVLKIVEGDILDVDSVKEAMPENLDCVFHLAGSVTMDSRFNELQTMINVEGTKNVLEVVIEKGVNRFIHTSSTTVYTADSEEDVINEESYKGALDCDFHYGRTKFLGEQLVLEASKKGEIDAVIIQPNFILGEHDILGMGFSKMFNKIYRKKLPMLPPGGGGFADIREVGRALVSAFKKGRNGECYILGGEFMKHKDLVAVIGKELKMDAVPQWVAPKWMLFSFACLSECFANCFGKKPMITTQQVMSTSRIVRVDSSKAMKELGYRISSIEELVKRQVKYMKEHDLFEHDLS